MIYMIHFESRNGLKGHFNVKAADQTEAVKIFMPAFYERHPGDAVKLTGLVELEMTGDMSLAETLEEHLLEGDEGDGDILATVAKE